MPESETCRLLRTQRLFIFLQVCFFLCCAAVGQDGGRTGVKEPDEAMKLNCINSRRRLGAAQVARRRNAGSRRVDATVSSGRLQKWMKIRRTPTKANRRKTREREKPG